MESHGHVNMNLSLIPFTQDGDGHEWSLWVASIVPVLSRC